MAAIQVFLCVREATMGNLLSPWVHSCMEGSPSFPLLAGALVAIPSCMERSPSFPLLATIQWTAGGMLFLLHCFSLQTAGAFP